MGMYSRLILLLPFCLLASSAGTKSLVFTNKDSSGGSSTPKYNQAAPASKTESTETKESAASPEPAAEKPAPKQAFDGPPADYDWFVKPLDGGLVGFSSFKGKTVFLNFWATWCGPCRAEMPGIQSLYEKTKGKGIEFVAVSWEDPAKVRNFIAQQKYSFPVYTFSRPSPKAYASTGIPVTFILSPDGKIVKQQVGAIDWDKEAVLQFLLGVSDSK